MAKNPQQPNASGQPRRTAQVVAAAYTYMPRATRHIRQA